AVAHVADRDRRARPGLNELDRVVRLTGVPDHALELLDLLPARPNGVEVARVVGIPGEALRRVEVDQRDSGAAAVLVCREPGVGGAREAGDGPRAVHDALDPDRI